MNNRIVKYTNESPDSLIANDLNFRVHPSDQKKIVTASIQELGWFDYIIVSVRTNKILNGHARVQIAKEEGCPTVPVRWVDVDRGEEQAILASYDAIGSASATDSSKLAELLKQVDRSNRSSLTQFFDKVLAKVDKKPQVRPKKAKPDVVIQVGDYAVSVGGEKFALWYAELKKKHKSATPDEIKRRLGF